MQSPATVQPSPQPQGYGYDARGQGVQPIGGGGHPPYAGGQPPYAGGQPPYAGGQPPYGQGYAPVPGGVPPYGNPQMGPQVGAPYGQYGPPMMGQQLQPGQAPYGQPQMAPYGQQPGYGQPVQTGQPGQPRQVIFMDRPAAIPGVPPGLEYISQIDQLLIHQQVEIFEMLTGWETSNKYQIKNTLGQQVYFAGEESDACARQCCGPQRGFVMHITDNLGAEVIRVTREFKCCAGYNCCAGCDCCAMEIRVEAPIGQVCGYTRQTRSCLAPKYVVLDAQEQPVLQIEGPACICQGPCCTRDQEFKVFTSDFSQEVGKLSKQWSGFVKEYFTDADNFCASFPLDLDVRIKAVLIGTVFLIDFMFFEQKQNNNN